MTRTLTTLGLAAALAGTVFVRGPSPAAAGEPSGAARAEIQKFVRAYVEAQNKADATAIMEMVSRAETASSINEGTIRRGWQAIRDAVDELVGAEGSYRVSLGTMEIQELGPSHALIVAPFTLTVEEEDGPTEIRGGMTLVLEKSGGEKGGARWKIIHEHLSAQPPEDEDQEGPDEGD